MVSFPAALEMAADEICSAWRLEGKSKYNQRAILHISGAAPAGTTSNGAALSA